MSYANGPKIVTDGLVLYLDAANRKSYPLSGSTIYDLSGNGNNGTFGASTAAPTFSSVNGGVLNFDGGDDISLTSSSDFAPGTGDFSFQCWINPSSWPSSWGPIFVVKSTGGLWIGKGSTAIFVLRAYSVANYIEHDLPTTSTWTHISITREGTSAKLYYNGSLVDSGTTSQNFIQANASIGTDGGSPHFYGKIPHVMLYKGKALSANEVQQNYNALKGRYGL